MTDGLAERGALLGLCYRMLGSLTDAEDAVQETYARWLRLSDGERGGIRHPKSWLMKAASRVCLDMLGSARARREQYWGEWLPEPVPNGGLWTSQSDDGRVDDPSDRVSLDESVSMAVLVVLESMTPAERVAFVLHDVFQYAFAEIAEIVGRTPQACRQLASSARSKIAKARTESRSDPRRGDILRAFKSAWETGDVDGLIGLLDPDVVVVADGGGKATAALRPIHGPQRIAQFLSKSREQGLELNIEVTTVNGEEGLVARDGEGSIIVVMAFGVADDRIQHIWAVRNPDKLVRWS